MVLVKPSRKSKCYVSADALEPDSSTRSRAESIFSMNVLGTRLYFFPTLEQRAEIAIFICKQFAQLLAIPLANSQVPDSLTTKIKTVKISETCI